MLKIKKAICIARAFDLTNVNSTSAVNQVLYGFVNFIQHSIAKDKQKYMKNSCFCFDKYIEVDFRSGFGISFLNNSLNFKNLKLLTVLSFCFRS